MKVETAVKALSAQLDFPPWLTMIGVGEHDGRESIFVYVRTMTPAVKVLPSEWQGYPVIVKRMGQPRPASRPISARRATG